MAATAGLFHYLQVSRIAYQALVSQIHVVSGGISRMALHTSHGMGRVHFSRGFMAADAFARVLAWRAVFYLRRSAPPYGVQRLGCFFIVFW